MLSRRTFCEATSVGIALHGLRTAAQERYALQNCATEAIRSADDDRRKQMYDELVDLFAKHIR